MHPALRCCAPFALCVLAACSPDRAPNDAHKSGSPPPSSMAAQSPALQVKNPQDEKCTHEPRTDPNDQRPRCAGMGSPQASDSHAYRITLENGESFTTCDITRPFSGKIGRGMITLKYTPNDRKSGKVDWVFAGGGGMANTAYTYTLDGPEDKMTATYTAAAAVTGRGSGLTVQAKAVHQTFTDQWTRIDHCEATP